MEVSSNLKKEIVIEICVLILMAAVIIYAYFAIGNNNNSNVINQDGFVLVLDKNKKNNLDILSDGEGLESDYVRYTITNNNSMVKKVKLVIIPDVDNKKVLDNVRIGINDLMVNDLVELEKTDKGYVVDEFEISPGFTRNYLFKYWLSLDSDKDFSKEEIEFSYEIILEEL